MKPFRFGGPRSAGRLKRRARVIVLGSIAMAGCSMMQPYETPKWPAAATPVNGLILAGRAGEALDTAEALRKAYYDDLVSTALVRNGTAVLASGLSGWAIYRGLEPSSVDSGSATAADKKVTLRLGVVLATLYGLREFFVNPDQESAYAEGYRSLTCLMLASRPLLMTRSASAKAAVRLDISPPENVASSALVDSVLPPLYTDEGRGDLDRLQLALDKLEAAILQVNLTLAYNMARADDDAAGNQDIIDAQASFRRQAARTIEALVYARNALSDGRLLVRTIENSGRDISDRVSLIAATVNDQVRDKQHDFSTAATRLKNAQDITTGVLNIGSATAADQTVVSATGSVAAANPNLRGARPIVLAGPMSAAWGPLFGAGGSPLVAVSAATVTASAPASASVDQKPAAASGVASKTPAPAKKGKTKAADPKQGTADQPITSVELQAIRDRLDAGIKAATAREQKAVAAAAAASAVERLKHVQDVANSYVKQHSCPDSRDGTCTKTLAKQTELLYAARRPVAQELLNFRRIARDATVTPECSELAVLRVQPNEAHRILAGETVTYVVSQRAAGSPLAVLQGSHDKETGISFTFAPIQGTTLYTATVTAGSRMPRQNVQLVISDSKGVTSQILPIVAGGARPPALPEEAASKAADPAASAASAAAPKASAASS